METGAEVRDEVYRELIAAAPDGVLVTDASGRIVLHNNEITRMFGYSPRELANRPIELLVPTRARSTHASHRTNYVAAPHARPMGAGLQLAARRKDGTEFPVEISLSPIISEGETLVTAIIRDISERRRAEETIRSQAEILELVHDPVIVLDVDGRVQYWNSGAEREYGWTADEARGEILHEFLKTKFPISREARDQDLLERGTWEGELEQITQDGSRVIVESRQVMRRGSDGRPIAVIKIDRDISQRRMLEQERERLLLERERQEDRDRIAMDLHDGVIQAIYATTLRLEAVADDVGDIPAARARIEESISRLQDVVADVRSYIYELRASSNDVAALLQSLIADFQTLSGIVVELQIDGDVALGLDHDFDQMAHIVREALTNVHKHANASRVHVNLGRDGQTVILDIVDDGDGFDADGARPTSQNGLRNLHARAASLGGELQVRSSTGFGTTLSLRLPSSATDGNDAGVIKE